MHRSASPVLRSCIATALALGAMSSVLAAEQNSVDFETVNEIVVTGTRVADRSRLDTLSPVDVLPIEAVTRQGSTELAQALSSAVPSLNFPRPGISDGTDSIRPITLRGLAPDQTLVLVNSKRRHQSALVNVNQTIGRGSASVDLNAIPAAAIERIEVLRDGASAQYGSDAIAGVVNIQLREAREGGEASLTFGRYDTDVDTISPNNSQSERSESDGDTLTGSVWAGFGIGETGFLTLSGEYRDRDSTSRGAVDTRVTPNVVTSQYGDADIEDMTFYLNAGVPVNENWEVYGWAGVQKRDTRGAVFPRLANDATGRVSPLFPGGFRPDIVTDVDDLALAIGTRTQVAGWDLDVGLVYGLNELDYGVENSINASLGSASPTSFDAGGIEYDQTVLSVGLVRAFEVGSGIPVNVAVGFEGRRETYQINAGQLESYVQGTVMVPITQNGVTTIQLAPRGSQGFPGFQPGDEVDEDREAYGIYVDVESQLTQKFLASIAFRGEDYSDFGSTFNGKISARYDFVESFAIRGTISTGFRAPSLQQSFFSSVATNFVNGNPVEIGTFPIGSPAATALGAKELDNEESTNYSLGFVFRKGNFEATLDAYKIDIDDRIVLSENINAVAPFDPVLTDQLNRVAMVRGGRFFLNGVDTETEGVDLVLRQRFEPAMVGRLDVTLFGNYNTTEVTKIPPPFVTPTGIMVPAFARLQINSFEDGTPEEKVGLVVDWSRDVGFGGIGAVVRTTYYGEVTEPMANPALDVDLGDHVLVDLSLRARVGEKLNFSVGVDNITDEYPDRTAAAANPQAALAYSRYSPFGFNGRFFYGRASFSW